MTRVRRLPHVDSLAVEDGTVVLHGERASLLSAVSAALWSSLDEFTWSELDQVSGHLNQAFGPPPNESAVPNLLAELADAGLIEFEP